MKKAILKSGTLTKQGVLNDYNNLIQGNFDELNDRISTILISTLLTDLQIDIDPVVIPGSVFVPAITKEPSVMIAIQIDGSDNGEVQTIIQGFEKNGLYYDIVIAPLDEQLLNVKISVL